MYPDLFLTVFNSCLRLKTFPRCWKNAKIILIPKVNDVRVPKLDNLRCISLLSTLGIVPFICYGSQIWGSALKKKIYCRLLRKIQRRILLRVISGYRTISYEAVFAISGFPPIDIFIIRNNEFKIATKNCTNKCLDGSWRVSELPHPSERFPLTWLITVKILKNNFPVVCFTDGSKINSKVGLAFVIFQDFIEIGTRQFRIRDECSVFQAELLCIAQAVSWICNNEILPHRIS
ncbi:retrovirus-related Pol polyprotein from type-1 retrotransposable element R1 4 [Trichonephila clavipes]|nr:retrovirus-related Pol polyprotein from type-1 retrotransposable element R1 4 [Trichonephila clavipes]